LLALCWRDRGLSAVFGCQFTRSELASAEWLALGI
jgi:hypothetical protein